MNSNLSREFDDSVWGIFAVNEHIPGLFLC